MDLALAEREHAAPVTAGHRLLGACRSGEKVGDGYARVGRGQRRHRRGRSQDLNGPIAPVRRGIRRPLGCAMRLERPVHEVHSVTEAMDATVSGGCGSRQHRQTDTLRAVDFRGPKFLLCRRTNVHTLAPCG